MRTKDSPMTSAIPPSPPKRATTLSYAIDGSILTIRASGTQTRDEREPLFVAVRADARVPNAALLLLDVREVDVGMSAPAVLERLRVLFDLLGPKLGAVCAVIVTAGLADQARLFQAEAIGFGIRVRLFSEERSARQWLNANKTGYCDEYSVAPMA